MHRRNFFAGLAGLSTLAWTTAALRAKGTMSGAMGNMTGMGNMPAMNGMDAPTPRLASARAIPMGGPLQPPRVLQNETSEAGKFRATLVAAPTRVQLVPGQTTEVWSYNDSFPGPLLELTAGDDVEITLHNRLPQATTIHWHGLPVPADQDGNPSEAVPAGGSRVYRFTLPTDISGL